MLTTMNHHTEDKEAFKFNKINRDIDLRRIKKKNNVKRISDIDQLIQSCQNIIFRRRSVLHMGSGSALRAWKI